MDRNLETVETEARISGYDVEERLHLAERRYARAREQLARVRDECASLDRQASSDPAALEAARVRVQKAHARCVSIRHEIAELERLLDFTS